jgi:hypothetical protein
MEPGDDLLDGPSAGRQELQAIVERAGRHRRRSVAGLASAAALVALAAGGGIGYAVSNHGGKAQTVVAGSSPGGGTPTPAVAGNSGSSMAPVTGSNAEGAGPTYTHLFTRTAGSVTIRAYQPDTHPAATVCGEPAATVQADVSTPDVAGVAVTPAFAPNAASGAILSVWGQEIGRPEGHPVDVVLVQVGASVKQVKVDFAGAGSDDMAPVQGWAVLADPAAAAASVGNPLGTVSAIDAAGKTLRTQPAYLGGGAALPAEGVPSTCFCPPIGSVPPGVKAGGSGGAAGSGTASSGTASTGTGSAGTASSGTASPGQVSSGAATVAPMCPRPLPAVTIPPPPTSAPSAG